MHTINRRNGSTPLLEPLRITANPMISMSQGPGSASRLAVVNVNNDATDLAFDSTPDSPTSTYSFDSFIEESYVTTPKSLDINVLDIGESHPRSYFSPDSAEFDEKWDEPPVEDAIDTSYVPYASRNVSATSFGSGRSVSPSIRATAERVKFTPVRAVRRSMRQSLASQLSVKFHSTYEDAIGGEKNGCVRPAVWRPYTAMLKLLTRANSYVAIDEAHHPSSITDAAAHAIYSPERKMPPPVLPPFPFTLDKRLVSENKYVACTAGSHKFKRSRSTPALKTTRRPTTMVIQRASDSDMEGECEDMDGIHDLTLEATEIAACLSAKWKFEPLPQGEETQKRRASL
ncbi:hypothetical protein D9619_013405 [Psilocybe cf. subviscida]|uniref:Uncharacterized protein n=1 Tax=Psilocybe cf. subviscida TaxID=2480587 RepID=A0A8H5F934_9AGAR|nr:hypothetical protein D9619_013405 [Psilocybe cf. subviscida]